MNVGQFPPCNSEPEINGAKSSEATRLIKVLIEGPRVCCGGGRVAVNCRACVIPVSFALSLSLYQNITNGHAGKKTFYAYLC